MLTSARQDQISAHDPTTFQSCATDLAFCDNSTWRKEEAVRVGTHTWGCWAAWSFQGSGRVGAVEKGSLEGWCESRGWDGALREIEQGAYYNTHNLISDGTFHMFDVFKAASGRFMWLHQTAYASIHIRSTRRLFLGEQNWIFRNRSYFNTLLFAINK